MNNTYRNIDNEEVNAHRADAFRYYGGEQNLLSDIHNTLQQLLAIPRLRDTMQELGLHPASMLQKDHAAYFLDKIAQWYLDSYDPRESDYCAVQRCITEQLHRQILQMEHMQQFRVHYQQELWEHYPLDSLLRLVWRCRDRNGSVRFFLRATDQQHLAEGFCFHVCMVDGKHCITLHECAHQRVYILEIEEPLDFQQFFHWAHRAFRLATEDYGYFIPACAWIDNNGFKEEE